MLSVFDRFIYGFVSISGINSFIEYEILDARIADRYARGFRTVPYVRYEDIWVC